jgi:hypothetical protein
MSQYDNKHIASFIAFSRSKKLQAGNEVITSIVINKYKIKGEFTIL